MTELLEQCKICGEGVVRPSVSLNPYNYRGVYSYVPLSSTICSICGSESAEPVQLKINILWKEDFEQKVDRFLEDD